MFALCVVNSAPKASLYILTLLMMRRVKSLRFEILLLLLLLAVEISFLTWHKRNINDTAEEITKKGFGSSNQMSL